VTIAAAPYIQFDQDFRSPQQTLCHGVVFVLDHDGLLGLLQAKYEGKSLYFSNHFSQAWRRYVLFQDNDLPQFSLSFVLRYEGVDVCKTLLGFDGDVLHQVAQDLLLSPSLYHQLAEIQAWLMAQLLAQLAWQGQGQWLIWAAWILAIALGLISMAISWSTLMAQPALILLVPIATGFLGWGLQRLLMQQLRPNLRRWLLAQILEGSAATNRGLGNWKFRLLHNL
jgi:hypothetical protein